jgi:hypothetical protein
MKSIKLHSVTMAAAVAVAAVCPVVLTGAAAMAAGLRPAAAAPVSGAGGTWGKAELVPGSAALNQGGGADIDSVSCASAGNCGAGGYYADISGHRQALVADERDGTWGKAQEVPGSAALNRGGFATIFSVSCTSAGNCGAGGQYASSSGRYQAFVADERNGTWGKAQEVPGSAALNRGGDAAIASVSCTSAGNCSAGGHYSVSSDNGSAFVVNETNGTWGKAQEVPGLAALDKGVSSQTNSVSCVSAGNCSAGGEYAASLLQNQAFVVNETNGTWGKAKEVPGIAAFDPGGGAGIVSVSCPSAGNCGAGGFYYTRTGQYQVFVADETNGTWGKAQQIPGLAALNTGGGADFAEVSCASAGNCSAGGDYTTRSGHTQAFVARERHGTWGTAQEAPGTAALNTGGLAVILSVSCASAGNCSAGGYYTTSSRLTQAFVMGEVNGTWGKAQEVPGAAVLNQGGDAGIDSVSCASAGNCSAGGEYLDGSLRYQAFVVGETSRG